MLYELLKLATNNNLTTKIFITFQDQLSALIQKNYHLTPLLNLTLLTADSIVTDTKTERYSPGFFENAAQQSVGVAATNIAFTQ